MGLNGCLNIIGRSDCGTLVHKDQTLLEGLSVSLLVFADPNITERSIVKFHEVPSTSKVWTRYPVSED